MLFVTELPLTRHHFIQECHQRFQPTSVSSANLIHDNTLEFGELLDFIKLGEDLPNLQRFHAVSFLLHRFLEEPTVLRKLLGLGPNSDCTYSLYETYETATDPLVPVRHEGDYLFPQPIGELMGTAREHLQALHARFEQDYGAPYDVIMLLAEVNRSSTTTD